MSKPTRIVLDGMNPDHVKLLARVQWDQGCITGMAFDDLSPNLRKALLAAARELLLDLAGQPDVTVLPAEETPEAA